MLDTSLWQVHWQGNFEAVRPTANTYTPMPPTTVPIQFDKPLIAVSARSNNALPHWQTAGWISQEIYSGILISGIPETEISNQRVFLNRVSIFQMSLSFSSTYSITYRFPRWLVDLSLFFWQYTGEIQDNNDIRRILLRVEQKVDDISEFSR